MPRDIEKVRKARRDWYARNKEHAKAKIISRKNELREWLKEIKSHLKCNKCGENHIACLEFHHTDPSSKDAVLANVVNNGWSKQRILKEIEKCEVLCSNCHRKLHWERSSTVE